jgi:large repetitive protein
VSSTSVSCFGGSNGTASSSATGGTFPYNYSWLPGTISGQNISNLPDGTYTITATDIKGCIANNTISVSEPTQIMLTTGSVNSNCSLANGQASVSASGGISGYTYTWTPIGGNNATATGLLAGSYSVQVTDANSCVASASQSIANNPGPVLSVSSSTNVNCFGGNDGSAFASVAGGSGPFTYTWTPFGGSNQTATGLSVGSYTVNITSANGCNASAATSPDITQPSLIFANISTSNVSCFAGANGSATITIGGGTPSYTCTWLPGATTGTTVSGLTANNNYSVVVNDANNCSRTFTFAITQPTAGLSANATSTAVSCFAGSNGIASVTANGGTSPYTYNWLPISVSSQTVSSLATGIYSVNVTDFKNCVTTTTVLVSQPTQSLSATGTGVATSCSGGSDGTATVTPVGGTPGYTYQWSPTGGANQSASSLLPGTYIITISDLNGCQTNVSLNISSPTAISGSLIPVDAACSLPTGSISSQVSGGVGPYTYSWSPTPGNLSTLNNILPGTYTLLVSDFYGCTKTLTTSVGNLPGQTVALASSTNVSCFGGNNGQAAITINQGTAPYAINWLPYGGSATTASLLVAGIYTANVIDARGCTNSITATISEPTQVLVAINSVTNVSCFGGNNGAINITANGGTPGYTYTWSAGGNNAILNNVSAGSYTVNVSDANNCSASISASISQPTAALTSTITSALNPLCFNSTGSSSVAVQGGTAPYSYSWNTTPIQTDNTATGLTGGSYTVIVKDANNCSSTNTVTLIQPTQISTNAGINDTICLGQSGVLISSAAGGAGNYNYTWQPANVTNTGTLTIAPLANTNYTVVAFDQNGCAGLPDTVRAIVYSLNPSDVQTFGVSPICPGQSSIIYAIASGNTGPITYTWNNSLGSGPGSFIVSPTQPTTYVVTVSNSCGASVTSSIAIAFNPPPTVSVTADGSVACIPTPINFNDFSITGNTNDPITSWNWDFGDGNTSTSQNPTHTYTSPGTYSISVTVTTDGGCVNNNASSPVIVNAYPYPDASFSVNSTVFNLPYDVLVCTNQSIGATNYDWSFGDGNSSTLTNPSYVYTSVGIYNVQLIATSQYGCKDTANIEITTDAEIVFPNAFTPNSSGANGGSYDFKNYDNDVFFPFHSGVIEYKLQIFNRWGELIFESEDVNIGWDGYYRDKICQVGVYVWKAYAKLNNGKIFNKTGDVTLLK